MHEAQVFLDASPGAVEGMQQRVIDDAPIFGPNQVDDSLTSLTASCVAPKDVAVAVSTEAHLLGQVGVEVTVDNQPCSVAQRPNAHHKG
jgi:hypothetical protein